MWLLGDDGVREAAAAQDAAALTLGGTTPDPVVDVMLECVLETGLRDGALRADPLRYQHAHAVIGEEHIRCNFFALPPAIQSVFIVRLPFHASFYGSTQFRARVSG